MRRGQKWPFLTLRNIRMTQGRSQEGLDPLRKNLNRSESTAQNYLEGPDPPGYALGMTPNVDTEQR